MNSSSESIKFLYYELIKGINNIIVLGTHQGNQQNHCIMNSSRQSAKSSY